MILSEKERTTIEDLQTQEKSCVEKYGKYAQAGKGPGAEEVCLRHCRVKSRSITIHSDRVLARQQFRQCDCNDTAGRDYEPKAII